MSDPKQLLVFGSFTEDETKSWMGDKAPKNSVKPVEKNVFQFGSLNLGSGIAFGNFGSEPSKQLASTNGKVSDQPAHLVKNDTDVNIINKASGLPGVAASPKENGTKKTVCDFGSEPRKQLGSTNGKVSDEPANLVKKDSDVNIVNKSSGFRGVAASPKENGTIENSTCKFPHSNGVKDFKAGSNGFTSVSLKQKDDSSISQSLGSVFSVLESELKDGDVDGATNGSLVYVKKEDNKKATAGPVAAAMNLLPRGLINSGNLCFLCATLQALLSCSPFVQLLQNLKDRDIPKVGFPTLNAFAEFISKLDMPSSSSLKKGTAAIETGSPLRLAMFESVLKSFTPDVPNAISGRPRQEDAQEFLSYVMDQMHDELLKLDAQSTGSNGAKYSFLSSTEDDDWETVGPKNKSTVTRTQSFIPSELSDIFGGQLKSVVTAKGNKASATFQPFMLVHLDIHPEAVRTIEDALRLFSAQENLEGYRASATGKAAVVSARKSVKIQTLSKIMILHLMRFSYGSKGSTKLHKPVHFPLEFMVGRDLLVSQTNVSRKYELVATITHHGREPSKGHYTADARNSNGQWLHYDDASVTAIGTDKVLHEQAYVLFYKQV